MSERVIPRTALEAMVAEHYVSTACLHLRCDECRQTCKFCGASCRHPCHELERITGNRAVPVP